MGYYTDYELTATTRKGGAPLSNDVISKLNDAVKQLNIFESTDVDGASWYTNAKWYDYENDMADLSKEFPDVFFELSGHGEDSEDVWIEYFCGGRFQYCQGRVVYDEPDMATLIGEDVCCDDSDVDDSKVEDLLKCV